MNHFEKSNGVLLRNFTYWDNKNLYLELMERFLNRNIDGTQFNSEFLEMWNRNRDKTYSSKELFDIIEHVDLNQLEGFAGLMSELFTNSNVFQPDLALRKNYEISEEELRNSVKKTFFKIQNW